MNTLNSIKITPPYETGYYDHLSPTHSALIHIAAVTSGQHPSAVIAELIDLVCSQTPSIDSPSSLVRMLGNATAVQLSVDDAFEQGFASLVSQVKNNQDKDKPNE
jgi:hypothetical protein